MSMSVGARARVQVGCVVCVGAFAELWTGVGGG
jgi:hypothetical protein